jgi:hypothetical protein
MHGTTPPMRGAGLFAVELGNHWSKRTTFSEVMRVATVPAIYHVFAFERRANSDGYSLLTDRKMRRCAHLLFFIAIGQGFFCDANTHHTSKHARQIVVNQPILPRSL